MIACSTCDAVKRITGEDYCGDTLCTMRREAWKAGRLAALRDDVELAAWQFDRTAGRRASEARECRRRAETLPERRAKRTAFWLEEAARLEASAGRFAAMANDCRRWLAGGGQ